MSILKIARMGHPVLRERARPLDPSEIDTPRVQRLIDDMFETMNDSQGIGLAGPQVHQSIRLFVAGVGDDESTMPPVVIINPEITPIGSEVEEDWEGCLSIPDIRGRVPRAAEVRVRALDRHGAPISMTANGFPARVVQHETDHLDGELPYDRMKSCESLTFLEESARFWPQKDS